MGNGMPSSQRRMPLPIVMVVRSLYCARREHAVIPRAVAQHAALGCRQAGGEGAEQERRGHSERQMHRAAPRIVGGGFGFGHDLIDAFLRIRLAHVPAALVVAPGAVPLSGVAPGLAVAAAGCVPGTGLNSLSTVPDPRRSPAVVDRRLPQRRRPYAAISTAVRRSEFIAMLLDEAIG